MVYRSRRSYGGVVFVVFALLFLWTKWESFQSYSAADKPHGKETFTTSHVKERPMWAGWQNLESLFVFGDSWTSMDFRLEGEQPSLVNPIGNPAFPGDVSSVGPNWAGFLTATYNATPVFTYNLGVGAATIARSVVEPMFAMTYTFEEQVRDKFVRSYAAKVKQSPSAAPETEGNVSAEGLWDPRTTLFAIWVGVVDIALLVRNHNDMAIMQPVFEQYASIVDMV